MPSKTKPQAPRSVASDLPPLSAWKSISTDLLARPGVTGCYLGKRTERGLLIEEWAVVVCVDKKSKVKRSEVPHERRIPESVTWPIGDGVVAEARTDIQDSLRPLRVRRTAAPRSLRGRANPIVGAGDAVLSYRRSVVNTAIGLITSHPDLGTVVTTAGHGFLARRTSQPQRYPDSRIHDVEVRLTGTRYTAQGRLRMAHMDDAFDFALLTFPPDIPVANLYEDKYPLGDIHSPAPADRHTPLTVLTPRGKIPVALTGLELRTSAGPGNPLRNVILTTPMTVAGDSGSVLVDEHYRPWGTLRGLVRINGVWHSAFASAHVMVEALLADSNLRPLP